MIDALAPDVMLLDIEMPGLDGLSVAEHPSAPPVIFTTAHERFALEAFEADAYDYLLKPVSRERLARALDKVRARKSAAPLEAPRDGEAWRLVVTDGSLKRFVDARQVDCFLADQKYVAFRIDDRELLVRESLDTLEQRLAPFDFLRVNRGALVRRAAILAYDAADGGAVVLAGDQRVPVSRRAAPAVRAALGL